MPNGKETIPPLSEEKRRLMLFLGETRWTLAYLVHERPEIFYEGFDAALREAWREGLWHFDRLAVQLLLARDEDLRYHGLTGSQLDLKLKAVEYFRGKLKKRIVLKWLKKLLDAINVILASLVDAIPGASGAAGELKDILEKVIDDDKEVLDPGMPDPHVGEEAEVRPEDIFRE